MASSAGKEKTASGAGKGKRINPLPVVSNSTAKNIVFISKARRKGMNMYFPQTEHLFDASLSALVRLYLRETNNSKEKLISESLKESFVFPSGAVRNLMPLEEKVEGKILEVIKSNEKIFPNDGYDSLKAQITEFTIFKITPDKGKKYDVMVHYDDDFGNGRMTIAFGFFVIIVDMGQKKRAGFSVLGKSYFHGCENFLKGGWKLSSDSPLVIKSDSPPLREIFSHGEQELNKMIGLICSSYTLNFGEKRIILYNRNLEGDVPDAHFTIFNTKGTQPTRVVFTERF
jgi:hypothetical protein